MKKLFCLLMAACMLLPLAACAGRGETTMAKTDVQTVKAVSRLGERRVEVAIDLSNGWSADFDDATVRLYEKAGDDTPIATGGLIDLLAYNAYYELHSGSVVASNGSLKFSEDGGASNRYVFPVEGGLYYTITARYGAGAEGIYDRFKVHLLGSGDDAGLDYLALVNKRHDLSAGWEDKLELVSVINPLGETIQMEGQAYAAYLRMRQALMQEGLIIGVSAAYKTEDEPEGSEHCTGLALDLYLRIDGRDVYLDEELQQLEYAELWERVHAKLADYGFLLRYPKLKEQATGFTYQPQHIRYIGDPALARRIASAGLTLEEYLGTASSEEVEIALGESMVFRPMRLLGIANDIKCEFAGFGYCALHRLRYAGDEYNSEANVEWLSGVAGVRLYQAALFLCDFKTGSDVVSTLKPNHEYTGYPCWVGFTEDGTKEILLWSEQGS